MEYPILRHFSVILQGHLEDTVYPPPALNHGFFGQPIFGQRFLQQLLQGGEGGGVGGGGGDVWGWLRDVVAIDMEEAGKRESLLHQGLSLCPPRCVHCVSICLFGQCKILGCLLIQRRVNIIWTNSSVAEKFWQALILRFLSSGLPKHGYSVRLFTGDHFGKRILNQEYLEYFWRDAHCSWTHCCF